MKIQDFQLLLFHLSTDFSSLCNAKENINTDLWNKYKSNYAHPACIIAVWSEGSFAPMNF